MAFQTDAFSSPHNSRPSSISPTSSGSTDFLTNLLPIFRSSEDTDKLQKLQSQLKIDPSSISSFDLRKKLTNLTDSGRQLRLESRVKIKADFETLFTNRIIYLFEDFILVTSEEYDPVSRAMSLDFFHAAQISSLTYDTEGGEGLVLQDQLTQLVLFITFRNPKEILKWLQVLEKETSGRKSLLTNQNGIFKPSSNSYINSFDLFSSSDNTNNDTVHKNHEGTLDSLNIFRGNQGPLEFSGSQYDEEMDDLYPSPMNSGPNSFRGGNSVERSHSSSRVSSPPTTMISPSTSPSISSLPTHSTTIPPSDSSELFQVSSLSSSSYLSPPGSLKKKNESPLTRSMDIAVHPEKISKAYELTDRPVPDMSFKVIVVGNSGVGKTNLITRFDTGKPNPSASTTVFPDYITKSYRLPGPNQPIVAYNLWDTAGQERFQSLMKTFYRGCTAAVVVYDVTSPGSFERLEFWMTELELHGFDDVKALMLVGNKCDLEQSRRVPSIKAKQFADDHGMTFFETSALTGDNVDDAFIDLFNEIYNTVRGPIPSQPAADINLHLSAENPPESSCSC